MLLSATSPVYAYTGMGVDELRAEIARLTQIADTIRTQLSQLEAITPAVVATPTSHTTCLQTNLHMQRGDRGAGVSALQGFLAAEGVYSDEVTGYFGPATEAAVQRWQSAHGIVGSGTPQTTGYGLVGPSTLSAMRVGCSSLGGSTLPNATTVSQTVAEQYSFSVNATSGKAPLAVTASLAINGSTCSSYMIDWGDGTSSISYDSGRSAGCTALPINMQPSHTYVYPGTYILQFKTARGPLQSVTPSGQFTIQVSL